MMNRIDTLFNTLSLNNQTALIPFIPINWPTADQTIQIVENALDAGAHAIELGVPFSDPLADGATNQLAYQEALNNGASMQELFKIVETLRNKKIEKPIVVFSYFNPIHQYGLQNFVNKAKEVGLDGVIIPDLIVEDSSDLLAYSKEYGVGLIFLMSPLCSPERIHRIVNASHTFIYLISSLGTTGMRQTIRSELADLVANIKAVKPVPVVVGFGISHTDHLKTVCSFSDGAVVGSYLIKQIEPLLTSSEQSCARIFDVISSFKQSMVVLS